jgi:hypothetical protein
LGQAGQRQTGFGFADRSAAERFNAAWSFIGTNTSDRTEKAENQDW